MQTYAQVFLNVYSAVAYPCTFSHIMREMNTILKTLLDIFKSYRCTTVKTFLPKIFLLNCLSIPNFELQKLKLFMYETLRRFDHIFAIFKTKTDRGSHER